MKTKQVLRIVLSYPGDVKAERLVMEDVIMELNQGIAEYHNLSLELNSWDTDAYPGFHPEGPQGIIDPILNIEDCDVLLGIFWKRFGTPTKNALSGTEHEIRTAIKAYQRNRRPQTMVYFKEAQYRAQSVEELDQHKRVLQFKNEFPKEGLYWTFEDVSEFERLARNHLAKFIRSQFALAKADTELHPPKTGLPSLILDYCLNVQQHFASIHLFGEKRRSPASESMALERMSTMERGFVPLHLNRWCEGDTSGEEPPLGIDDLFDTGDKSLRYLVRGLPGAGKTTLLRYLAHRMATLTVKGTRKLIPVYVRLRSFNCQKDTIEEWVRKEINKYCESPETCDALCARELFLDSPMLLLLDGLDEIEDEVTSQKIAELLGDLANDKWRCNIVVTGRPIGLERRSFPLYDPLDLKPLTLEMINAYLKRWFGKAADRADRLRQTLKAKPRIRSLVSNPFLLSMVCYAFEQGDESQLIERRSQLYEKCTRYLLERPYDLDSNNRETTDYQATREILKEISLRFFLWQESEFDVAHVNAMGRQLKVNDGAGRTEEALRCIERETGLIQRGQEGFTFVHRSLWEYFTALALLDKNIDFVIKQAANPDWEEVVRLYAGLLEDLDHEEKLIHQLWTINRPLALRVTTETKTPAAKLLQPLIASETDNRGKLLLINSLEQSLDLVTELERANLVQETLRILLIECQELDCEVIFHAQELLKKVGCTPLKPGGIVHELLDLGQAADRQERLLSDPANHFEWIEVGGGTFQMGDDHHENSEKPAHPVQLDTFMMAKHPVTNHLLDSFPWGEKYPNYGDESHPAVGNTWYEAYYFALWINARLPTEAEWEYAARGGHNAPSVNYFFGDDSKHLVDHAWFGETGRSFAHAVDEINPRTGKENLNLLGLSNMLGNIWEWVEDDWHEDYENALKDGRAWNDDPRGSYRVIRGGGWYYDARYCRSATRFYYRPVIPSSRLGFRLSRSVALDP